MSQRGSMRKRGESWTAYWFVPGTDGKRSQVSKGGFRTRRDAGNHLTAVLGALQDGSYSEPSKLLFGEYLTRQWLPAIEATVRPNTLASYRLHVERYIVPRLGGVRLQAVSPAALNAFYAQLLAGGRVKTGKGLSPSTVRRIHATLHRALRDATRWHLLPRNPADAADPPSEAPTAGKSATWNAAQLGAFLRSVQEDRLRAVWVLAVTTGMRRGELLGLRWTDVDVETGRLQVRQTLVSVNYRVQLGEPKTEKGRRNVALDSFTVAALKTWRAHQAAERLAWGSGWTDTGLVFGREDGSMIHPDTLTGMFAHRARTAGLPAIRLHDLRHSYISVALEGGESVEVISGRVGHATVGFTLDRYRHVMPGEQEGAAVRVAARLFGAQ